MNKKSEKWKEINCLVNTRAGECHARHKTAITQSVSKIQQVSSCVIFTISVEYILYVLAHCEYKYQCVFSAVIFGVKSKLKHQLWKKVRRALSVAYNQRVRSEVIINLHTYSL